MEIDDTYKTIEGYAESSFTEKRSRFLSFAHPVRDVDEVREIVKGYEKKYYDARHVCYSYMLGAERKEFRANDNGEPSGTAGKPILGQINSLELTDVLVIVVRYFGGIKLGTSGLIQAYKQAARDVLEASTIIEKFVETQQVITFEYPFMSEVMKSLRDQEAQILEQGWDSNCVIRYKVRRSREERLRERLEKIDTLSFPEPEEETKEEEE